MLEDMLLKFFKDTTALWMKKDIKRKIIINSLTLN